MGRIHELRQARRELVAAGQGVMAGSLQLVWRVNAEIPSDEHFDNLSHHATSIDIESQRPMTVGPLPRHRARKTGTFTDANQKIRFFEMPPTRRLPLDQDLGLALRLAFLRHAERRRAAHI